MRDPRTILEQSKTVAVVGLSSSPWKAAHSVPRRLQQVGYRILPVNPHADVLLGEPVHRRLEDIGEPVDLVVVFRPPREAAELARSAAAIGARALWLQLGITSAEARATAEAAGMDYVEDLCTAVEVARYGVRAPA